MRILALFAAGLVAAVGIGLVAHTTADDTPTACVVLDDGLGTVRCSS